MTVEAQPCEVAPRTRTEDYTQRGTALQVAGAYEPLSTPIHILPGVDAYLNPISVLWQPVLTNYSAEGATKGLDAWCKNRFRTGLSLTEQFEVLNRRTEWRQQDNLR